METQKKSTIMVMMMTKVTIKLY